MVEKETRNAIMQMGKSLILSQGYTATSIDAICTNIGITKGAFYYFFKSKAAFAEELLDYGWQPIWDMQNTLQDDSTDVMIILNKHINFMVGFILEEGYLMSILMQELAPKHPQLQDKIQGYFRDWTKILTSIIEIAKQRHHPNAQFESSSLMEFIVMTIEGVPQIHRQLGGEAVNRAIEHLKRYLNIILGQENNS